MSTQTVFCTKRKRCLAPIRAPTPKPCVLTPMHRICRYSRSEEISPELILYPGLAAVEQARELRGGAAAGADSSEDEEDLDVDDDDDFEDEDMTEEEDFGEANFVGRLKQDWRKTPIITKTFFQVQRQPCCCVPWFDGLSITKTTLPPSVHPPCPLPPKPYHLWHFHLVVVFFRRLYIRCSKPNRDSSTSARPQQRFQPFSAPRNLRVIPPPPPKSV